MGKYVDDLIKNLQKEIKTTESKNKEMRKGIYNIPSPSNSLKVSNNTKSKPVNTTTGQPKTSINNGKSLADRGYSSTVNEFKSGNSSKGFSKMAKLSNDIADYNAMTIGESYKRGNVNTKARSKAAKARAEELKSKYGVTDKELEQANKNYTKRKIRNSENKGIKAAEEYSRENPLYGELNRTLINPLSSLEGVGNVLSAKLGRGKEGQSDYLARLKEANTTGTNEKIENLNTNDSVKGILRGATDLGRSAVDMGVNTALQAATGLPMMGVISAGNTANDTMRDSLARGSDIDKASKVATANAIVDYILAQKGLDEIANLTKTGKNLGTTILKSAGIGGAEEGLQNLLAQATDTSLNYSHSQLKSLIDANMANGMTEKQATLKALGSMGLEDLQSAGAGALFGGLFPVGSRLVNGKPNAELPHNKFTGKIPEGAEKLPFKGETPKPTPLPNYTGEDVEITKYDSNSTPNIQEEITQPNVNNSVETNSLSEPLRARSTDYDYEYGDTINDFMSKNTEALRPIFDAEGREGIDREFRNFKLNNANSDIHEIDFEDARRILYDNVPQNYAEGWARNADSGYKEHFVDTLTQNPETRNAALIQMFENFKVLNPDYSGSFEEWVNTPVKMYRGTNGQNVVPEDIFDAYSFDRRIAEQFGDSIREIEVRPIDTYGSLYYNGEGEIFVPSDIARAETIDTSVPTSTAGDVNTENVQTAPINNEDAKAIADNIIKATKGYERLDADDISNRLVNGEDISDIKNILLDIADPESEMPRQMQEMAQKALNDIEAQATRTVSLDNLQVTDILNNVTTERSNANGQLQGRTSNDGTGSEGILHGVSEKIPVAKREYRYRIEGGEYLPPNRVSIAEQLTKNPSVFTDSDILSFENNGIEYNQLYDSNNDTALYSKALSTAIDNNDNGAAVDPRSAEEISEIISKGGKTFLSDDATAGIIIEGDGNLTGVFKDKFNNSTPRMGISLAIAGVKNGAIKGDCYGRFLVNSYSCAGLDPVARMKYEYGFNEKMDAQVREQIKKGIIDSEPDVYVLRLISDFDPNTAIEYSKKAKQYTQAELDALPLFEDYDEMLEYRDRLLAGENVSPDEYASFSADIMNEDIGIEKNPVENNNAPVAEMRSLPITDPNVNPETDPSVGYSKVVSNSGVNSGIVDEAELDTPEVRAVAEYCKADNVASLRKGQQRVREDSDGWEEKYASGKEEISTDVDVDTSMVILSDIKAKEKEAIKNGDKESVEALKVRRLRLLKKLREAGTRWGQNIQAFAKWNFTSDGAIINAEKMLNERAEKWFNKGKNAEKVTALSNKFLKALDMLVDDGTIKNNSKDSLEVIKQKVRNTLEAESYSVMDNTDGSNKNKRVFTEDDVSFIANLINQGASAEELSNYLAVKMATGKFAVSEDVMQKVNELFDSAELDGENSRARVEKEVEAWKLLADEVCGDATFWEKFDAWRYLAMLGNPKTHIRNMLGNAMFRQVTGFSNNIGALMEEWYSNTEKGKGMQRTKAVLDPRSSVDNELIRMSKEDINENTYRQLAGNKYASPEQGMKANKRIFKNKAVNFLSEMNSDALSVEDYNAKAKKYSTSLAGFLKANGLDSSAFNAKKVITDTSVKIRNLSAEMEKLNFDIKNLENFPQKPLSDLNQRLLDSNKAKMEDLKATHEELSAQLKEATRVNNLVEKGREYAVKSANYSTFNQDNALATGLNNAVRKLNNGNPAEKALAKLIEGLIPFKRTPMNIVKSIWDYSPLGFVNAAYDKGHADKDFRESIVIDDIAKAGTGTILSAVGYGLAKLGVININNDDQEYTNPDEGKQQYSVIINGKSYTIDFAVPAVAPLLMGASFANYKGESDFSVEEVFNALQNKDFAGALSEMSLATEPVTNAVSSLMSPVMETTMMSGINDALESLNNFSDDPKAAAVTFGSNLLGSYFSQAVPTISGQLARTIDPTRRSTYTDRTGVTGANDRKIMKMMNKTPLSRLNEPYVNTSGEIEKNSPFNNVLSNAAYQFLSPSYIQNVNPSDVQTMSDEVYELTGDSKALLNSERSPKIGKQRLSKSDMTEWSKSYGDIRNDLRDALLRSDDFKALGQQDKIDAISDIDTAAKRIANNELANNPNNKLSDKQIETATSSSDLTKWENSGNNPKSFVEMYLKHTSLTNDAKEAGVVSSSGNANTDRYEKLESATNGNMDVISELNKCYNDSGHLDTSKALTYFENNNVAPADAGKYMFELNGGNLDDGKNKKMKSAKNVYGYEGVYEYYNIRNYCDSDVTKQKVIEYLKTQKITPTQNRDDYVKWVHDVFGYKVD